MTFNAMHFHTTSPADMHAFNLSKYFAGFQQIVVRFAKGDLKQ
jgi:hypothetical protein